MGARLTSSEFAAIMRNREEAAKKGKAHRAQPLSVVEARERTPYTAPQGRPEQGWPIRRCSPEMAVYDPADDDAKREAMSPAEAWLLMVIYLLSACFMAWLLSVLAAYFGAVPQ